MRAELTSLLDLSVYTDKGKHVGRVNDLVLDAQSRRIQKLAIGNINHEYLDVDARGVFIPYRWVISVGDIILVKELPTRRVKREDEEDEE